LPATAAFHAIIGADAKAQMANAAISICLTQNSDVENVLQGERDDLYKRVTD
jgi:hypothetical protein